MINRCKLSSLVGALALTAWAATAAEPPLTSFRDATQDERESARAATGEVLVPAELSYEARCSTTVFRTAEVDLRWRPVAEAEAAEQRIDISKFRDGFERGRFETSGVLAASRDGARLAAPEPGVNYYWRVVRRSGEGWVPSSVERFEVPVCPWDKPKDPTELSGSRETGEGGQR